MLLWLRLRLLAGTWMIDQWALGMPINRFDHFDFNFFFVFPFVKLMRILDQYRNYRNNNSISHLGNYSMVIGKPASICCSPLSTLDLFTRIAVHSVQVHQYKMIEHYVWTLWFRFSFLSSTIFLACWMYVYWTRTDWPCHAPHGIFIRAHRSIWPAHSIFRRRMFHDVWIESKSNILIMQMRFGITL